MYYYYRWDQTTTTFGIFSSRFLLTCMSSMTVSPILMKTEFFEDVFITLDTHLAG